MSKSAFILENDGHFKDLYKIQELIGQEVYGEVRRCIHRQTEVIRAVKLIRKEAMKPEDLESFEAEISILRKLDHPNILKLYEIFSDDKRFYLVTELCEKGELFDEIIAKVRYNYDRNESAYLKSIEQNIDRNKEILKIKKYGKEYIQEFPFLQKQLDELKNEIIGPVHFSEKEAADLILQILQALAYCHEQKIVHRDIKPENVLIDKEQDNCLKIIDFGTSVLNDNNVLLTQTHGTSYYIAPEVLKNKYNEKCDVWSIGVMLYILLSGKPPFDGQNDQEITEKVIIGSYHFNDPIWQNISADAKGLVKSMMQYDYQKRASCREALSHKWFQNASSTVINSDLMKESLKNLMNFNAVQKMQQATMSMMVQNMITKEEIGRLQKVFQQLDKNKDGKLQYQELIDGYSEYYGEFAQTEVDRIFKLVDVDNSGEIDFSEFVTATVNRGNLLQDEKLKAAFGVYDKDGSGSISTDEIKDVLGVGGNISEEVWAQIVSEIDENGDGEVSFEEFKMMMVQLLQDKN